MDAVDTDKTGKVLFLGLAQSGKTTIISTLVHGFDPTNIQNYSATINYERNQYSNLDKKVTIFDLGGQKNFLDRFTGELAKFIFSKTNALVFVVDSSNVSELTRVKYYLDLAIKNIIEFAPRTPVFVFLHKTDLLKADMVEDICNNFEVFLKSDVTYPLFFFRTTILKSRAKSVLEAFNNILNKAAGREKIDYEEKVESPSSLFNSFVEENRNIITGAQILAENNAPLIASHDFNHVTTIDSRKVIDKALQYLLNTIDWSNSALLDSDKGYHYVHFLENNMVFYLSFSKEKMNLLEISISKILDKITILVNEIEKLP